MGQLKSDRPYAAYPAVRVEIFTRVDFYRSVRRVPVALSWALGTTAADVIAGYLEKSSYEAGGKEIEEGKLRGKLDGRVEGDVLFEMLLSACCGDVWAVSYRTKFQKAFSCRRLVKEGSPCLLSRPRLFVYCLEVLDVLTLAGHPSFWPVQSLPRLLSHQELDAYVFVEAAVEDDVMAGLFHAIAAICSGSPVRCASKYTRRESTVLRLMNPGWVICSRCLAP